VAPTLAALAGVRMPDTVDGESLVGLMRGEGRRDVPVSIAESWYPRLHFGWSELRSARVGEWKYIASPKPELYDLRGDRREQRNVVGERAVVAERLAADLNRVVAGFAPGDARPTAQPDTAAVKRLQALGYVGSFAPVTQSGGKEDPKDRLSDYVRYRELFNRALGLLGDRRAAEAVPILQRLVKINVRAFEAHLYLGTAYASTSRFDAALGEFEAAAQLNPSVAMPHYEAAKALSATGQHEAAAARCLKGLELEPDSFFGHYTLGVVYQKAARWTEALTAFQRAVDLDPHDAGAHANLAGAAMRLGALDRAAVHFERMVELGHRIAAAQFNLGVIAARKGDRAGAERRYRLALAADPKFKPALDALARIK